MDPLSMLLAVMLAGAPAAPPGLPSLEPATVETAGARPEITEELLVQLIRVDFLALDDKGRPVSGITADEVRIVEEGRERDVVAVEPVEAQLAARGPAAGRARVHMDLGRRLPGSSAETDGPDPGRWIVLVFDNLNGELSSRLRALDSARGFVEESLDPSDRVALVSLDRTLHFIEGFTRDRGRVLQALGDPGPWVSAVQRSPLREVTGLLNDLIGCDPIQLADFDPDNQVLVREPEACYMATANRYANRRREEAVTTLGQLTFLLEALEPIPDRKHLFFFSEGFSLEPSVETVRIVSNVARRRTAFNMGAGLFGDTRIPLERFLEAATRSRTSVFAMNTMEHLPGGFLSASSARHDLTGRAGASSRAHDPVSANRAARQESLRAIAAAAGGRAFEGSDVGQSLRRARAIAEGLYTLSYRADRPPGERGRRSLRVTVDRPGVRVAVRSSISVALPEAPPVRGHIGLAGITNLPMGITRVPFRLELARETLRFLRSGRLADAYVSLFAELMDLEGRRLDADFSWVGVTDLNTDSEERPDPAFHGYVDVPPGTFWLKIRVAQPDGYGLGEMERFFSVGARPLRTVAGAP